MKEIINEHKELLHLNSESKLEVDNTLTDFCDASALSFDHKGQLKDKARAKYSTSSGSGHIDSALLMKRTYSEKGINLILEANNSKASLHCAGLKPDLSIISCSCSQISPSKYSGAYNSTVPRKSKSQALFPKAISIEKIILASTINLIQAYASGCSRLNRAWMDLFIFRPNSRASFSVNFDLATIDLNNLSWETFSRIASRATSDQLMNFDSSISCFNSSGTDKVMVGIQHHPNIFNIFSIFNTVFAVNLFKS